ncbi:MAG: L-threonylcarbamoyladenylate synthase [Gemmatimonadota bacterium]
MSAASPAPLPRGRVLDATNDATLQAVIAEGAAIIRAGGLVAFPTETVYGLGADALDQRAVARIFAAKGRPAFNPVIVHIADPAQLERVVRRVPPIARDLAAAFWPGPLTLVLPRHANIPDVVTAGLDAVGIRIPAHPVARALIEQSGVPIAAPSANAYTRVSPTTAAHVLAQLGDAVNLILDGGPCLVGIESTVLDVTGPLPLLLRLGGISRTALEAVIGPVGVPEGSPTGDAPRPAPGMVERHYAPAARLISFSTAQRDATWRRVQALMLGGERVGVIAFDVDGVAATCNVRMPPDPAGYARELYAALHLLDRDNCSVAFVERHPVGGEWDAIADRLRRAGGGGRGTGDGRRETGGGE